MAETGAGVSQLPTLPSVPGCSLAGLGMGRWEWWWGHHELLVCITQNMNTSARSSRGNLKAVICPLLFAGQDAAVGDAKFVEWITFSFLLILSVEFNLLN